jgi:hypothetical protein
MHTPKKGFKRSSKRLLTNSHLKYRGRRHSLNPGDLKNFVSSDLTNINQENKVLRKSLKNDLNLSYKNIYLKELNSSIPEVPESVSNNSIEEKKNSTLKSKKNIVQNNKYYINVIKNVYENEHHLNKNSLIKKKSKFLNSSFINNQDSNKKTINIFKRRNSAVNKDLFRLNFDKNIVMEKLNMNRNISSTNVHKLKNDEVNTLLHKKNLNTEEKEIVKTYFKKGRNSIPKKGKDKSKKRSKSKNSGKKSKKSNENINNNKKVKEVDKVKDNDIENSTKAETATNSTKKKFKKFLCCLINNDNSSTENE